MYLPVLGVSIELNFDSFLPFWINLDVVKFFEGVDEMVQIFRREVFDELVASCASKGQGREGF